MIDLHVYICNYDWRILFKFSRLIHNLVTVMSLIMITIMWPICIKWININLNDVPVILLVLSVLICIHSSDMLQAGVNNLAFFFFLNCYVYVQICLNWFRAMNIFHMEALGIIRFLFFFFFAASNQNVLHDFADVKNRNPVVSAAKSEKFLIVTCNTTE